MSKEWVKYIAREYGGQSIMARELECKNQNISNFIRNGYMPYKYVSKVMQKTKVPLKDWIRPDYLEAHAILAVQEIQAEQAKNAST